MSDKNTPLNYQHIFDQRGESYNQASASCPNARSTERQLLIDRLDLQPEHSVIDIPAGGGYLAEGIATRLANPRQVTCIEPSREFIHSGESSFGWIQSSLTQQAIRTQSIDRIGSLAGLHHIDNKQFFFNEAFRVLCPGGKIVVADVCANTAVAAYLNGPVDKYSSTGHHGIFFARGDFSSLLHCAGFSAINESYIEYDWCFPDLATLTTYCKKLFGMSNASEIQVEKDLKNYLPITVDDNEARLGWSLIYASACKPLQANQSNTK